MKSEGHLLSDSIALLPCPFCGSEPTVEQIGNDHTKKRSVVIKCRGACNCKVEMKVSGFTNTVEWCQETVSAKWNKRQ